MDTNKEYIEMCRRATEIQNIWEPNSGDFTYIADIKSVNIYAWGQKKECSEVWLPRQDQLQGMWHPERSETAWAWNSSLTAFLNVSDLYSPIEKSKMSMEQLMLCLVMHEKYGKKWDGKYWAA